MIKIMVVDDEPLVRIGLKSAIDWEGNGFRLIAEASNGEQALKLIDETRPDIVITDIKMPVMDGIELIKEAKQKYPDIIPVVLSCHDDFEFVREAMKLGAADYFLKTNMIPDRILNIMLGLKDRLDSNREKAASESWNKRIIGECISILTDNFIKDLISDLVVSESEMKEKLKIYDLYNLENKYVLMVIRIDSFSDVKKKYIEKDEKLLQFSIKNMLGELYGKVPGFRMFIDSSEEYIVCWPVELEAAGKKLEEQLSAVAQKMSRIIKDYLNISISIGISLTHRGINEIKEAYCECKHALKFKFFKGKGCIVNFSDVRRVQVLNRLELVDEFLEKELKLAVKTPDVQAVSVILEHVRNKVCNIGAFIDEKIVKKAFIILIEIFNAFMREENVDLEVESDPYSQVLEAEDVEEILGHVESYFIWCITNIIKMSGEENRSCIREALDYINNYYDRDLSLQSVADKVGLNSSYFSRLFKKETGESFIDYLTRIRIDRSKQLLVKGVKAVEAAEKVGYSNYTYFSKLFKKVVGVNPSEYLERKQ